MTDIKKPFYVLEGLDGTGKTSVGKIIAQRLNFEFLDSLPEPFASRYTEFNKSIDPSSFYLFMLAQISHISNEVKRIRDNGKGVIVARYYPTTVAYAIANTLCFGNGKHYNIDPRGLGIEQPSHIFYLYAHEQERSRRLKLRGKLNFGDSLSLNDEYQTIIETEFSKFPVIRINTTSHSQEEVADRIIKGMSVFPSIPTSNSNIVMNLKKTQTMIKTEMNIGFGTWNFSGIQEYGSKRIGWPVMHYSLKKEVLESVFRNDIKFIDTSDFYGEGEVEKLIGEFLQGKDEIIVATKGGLLPFYDKDKSEIARDFSVKHLSNVIEKSRDRIRRDKIDLYQLHGPTDQELSNPVLWEFLSKEVDRGTIGKIGISLRKRFVNRQFINEVIKNPLIYSVQLPIDLSNQESIDLLFQLRKANKKIIGRSPFFHGLLFKGNTNDLAESDPRLDFVDQSMLKKMNQLRLEIETHSIEAKSFASTFYLNAIVASGLYDLVLFGSSSSSQVSENSLLLRQEVSDANLACENFLKAIINNKDFKNCHATGLAYKDFRIA